MVHIARVGVCEIAHEDNCGRQSSDILNSSHDLWIHGAVDYKQVSFSLSFLYVGVLNCFSGVHLFATPETVACQAPVSMGFSRQEYWSGLPLPPPGDLLDPGIKSRSPALQADSFTTEPPRNDSFSC